MAVQVQILGVPDWIDPEHLLGPGAWTADPASGWTAELDRRAAADLSARLRGVGLGGHAIQVTVVPPLKRARVRAARTEDARRRRDTTVGFSRPGCRLDPEGRMSLTPESLALALGERAAGRSVVDACGGCGGNAIGFARAGSDVVLIEPNPTRLEMARHNAAIYGVDRQIHFVLGSALDLLREIQADLLFLDPPWGADWNRQLTRLEDLPLLGPALEAAADRFAETWLKLPPSFDMACLPHARPEAVFGHASGDRQRVKWIHAAC